MKVITKGMVDGLLLLALLLGSSVSSAEERDPWEGFNRRVFVFNEFVDQYLFRPIAVVYNHITPEPVDDGVTNVFDNLQEIKICLNNALQGKFQDAASDAGRLLVNTTIGVAGFFDVASSMGLDKNEEDFGQTFGVWRVGSGPYLVLPFLGPSTVRDALGRIPDGYLLPQRYIDHVPTRNSVYAVDLVDTRSDLFEAEEMIQGDKYTFIRDVYLQRRDFLVTDGAIEDEFTADDIDDDY